MRTTLPGAGFRLVHVDSTVILERPKLKDYRLAIRQSLAETLDWTLDRVSVKFKTAEGVGPVGEGRSAEAQARRDFVPAALNRRLGAMLNFEGMYKEVAQCRVCGNPDLIPVLNLGKLALTGVFPRSVEEIPNRPSGAGQVQRHCRARHMRFSTVAALLRSASAFRR